VLNICQNTKEMIHYWDDFDLINVYIKIVNITFFVSFRNDTKNILFQISNSTLNVDKSKSYFFCCDNCKPRKKKKQYINYSIIAQNSLTISLSSFSQLHTQKERKQTLNKKKKKEKEIKS